MGNFFEKRTLIFILIAIVMAVSMAGLCYISAFKKEMADIRADGGKVGVAALTSEELTEAIKNYENVLIWKERPKRE